MEEKINIIMIGIGHHHADGIMQELLRHSRFHVLGYYEPNEIVLAEKINADFYKGLKRYEGRTDVVADKKVQALFVEAPAEYQVDYAMSFIDLRLPMHLDKPVGIDFDKTKSLFSIMKKNDIPFQVGYMYRYNPAVLEMKKMYENGDLGEIYNVEAVMNTDNNKSFREWLSTYSGGSMFILGCHMIDIVYSIMGYPSSIISYVKKTGRDSADSCDLCSAVWEYPKGIAFIQATCIEAGGYGRRRIIVSGSKGSIEIQPMENPTKMYFSKTDPSKAYTSDDKKQIDLSKYPTVSRYTYMLDNFAAIANNDDTSLYFTPDYDYEITLQELIIKSLDKNNMYVRR